MVPANSHNPDQMPDDEAAPSARGSWRDYRAVQRESETENFEVRQRVFDPSLHPSPPPGVGDQQVLKEEERRVINHAPGRSEKSQSARLAHKDKIEITERYCELLHLPDEQTRAAQRLMAELNLDKFGNQKRIEKIALVVIRHLDNKALANNPNLDYSRRITANERYKDLLEENGIDLGDVMRLSHKLKQILREQEADLD